MNEQMKKLINLRAQRADALTRAEKACNADDMETYKSAMAEVEAYNAKIEPLEKLTAEMGKYPAADENNTVAASTLAAAAPSGTRTIDRASNEYARTFCYALREGITPQTAFGNERYSMLLDALTETGGNPEGEDGGFLVPVDLDTSIREARRQQSALAELFTVESVTTRTGFRVKDTAPTAGFTKIAEMAEIPKDDQPKFSRISYAVEDYALIVAVSNDLLKDNTAGLLAYLGRWFGRKGVITENKNLIALLDKLSASAVAAGAEIAAIKKALNVTLDPAISSMAAIVTNQTGFHMLDSLEDKNGRPLLQPDPTTGTPTLFKSRRVHIISDAQLPNRKTGTKLYTPCYIGDFKQYGTLFRREPLEVASTSVGGNSWTTNSTEVRGIMRMDEMIVDSDAACKCEFEAEVA